MAEFVPIARAADVPPGTVRTYQLNGTGIALCNVDGRFYAIEDVCTHDGGELGEGYLEGEQIECPRHGARFDVTSGRALTLPAVMPVRSFPVELEGEEIRVKLEAQS